MIPIYLPPLRERKEDIPSLVDHFLKRLNQQMKKNIKGRGPGGHGKADAPRLAGKREGTGEHPRVRGRHDERRCHHGGSLFFQSRRSSNEETLRPLKEARDAFERGYLIKLLQACKGNVSEAAELAGKYRTDFYSLLKKHSLNPGDFR